ncbi:hypothetical protein [Haloglomus salinum]|uniref:hypothetical protein n=1 Tax=Haloglomus salinum TaxID=2962673 RepID=UPI0020C9BE6D|nr:hypothetical protein [Haloglomus salinum]
MGDITVVCRARGEEVSASANDRHKAERGAKSAIMDEVEVDETTEIHCYTRNGGENEWD